MLEKIFRLTEKMIPEPLFRFFQPYYHFLLSYLGALYYGFPSEKMLIIGVTGTKGKTTTSEIIYKIFREVGFKVALINTVEFRIGAESERNLFKMTTPGRFFLQKFLARAKAHKCTHVIIEITSEAVLQSRHRFLHLDALVVTNISPEHIERHGSYQNYKDAKLEIAKRLLTGTKPRPVLVTNGDDRELKNFRSLPIFEQYQFRLSDVLPYETTPEGTTFTWHGKKVKAPFISEFNLQNVLAALTLADVYSLPEEKEIAAVEKFKGTLGRAQRIEVGQNFTVVIDYAHTADSMKKLYEAFPGRRICVFGATGGGRDKWKRPEMGKIASEHCDEIILTNDDPYDEKPINIITEIRKGITNPKTTVELNRRKAIALALSKATPDSVVLISGKGTDPYLMEKGGKRTPWDDAKIAKEELEKLIK